MNTQLCIKNRHEGGLGANLISFCALSVRSFHLGFTIVLVKKSCIESNCLSIAEVEEYSVEELHLAENVLGPQKSRKFRSQSSLFSKAQLTRDIFK